MMSIGLRERVRAVEAQKPAGMLNNASCQNRLFVEIHAPSCLGFH